MKKTLSVILVLLAFISVISPAACAIGGPAPYGQELSWDINHPALWGGQMLLPNRSDNDSEKEAATFNGRIILIVVVALLGIIFSTALILLNVKYSKLRKEEEAEETRKKGKTEAKQ